MLFKRILNLIKIKHNTVYLNELSRLRAFGFRGSNSTSGRAVQANPTRRFSQKKNDSTLLNFSDYEQKPTRKMKCLLLVFCKIVAWFLPSLCIGSGIFCTAISSCTTGFDLAPFGFDLTPFGFDLTPLPA